MTLLIVILTGIKRDFSFLDHEFSHSGVFNFPAHSMAVLFAMFN